MYLKYVFNTIICDKKYYGMILVFYSKVDWRVKGNLLRGKDFTVSNNGNCPRCQSNVFVFVILDEYVIN